MLTKRVEEKRARVVCVSVNIDRRWTFSVTASKPSHVSFGGQFLTELENRNTLHISTLSRLRQGQNTIYTTSTTNTIRSVAHTHSIRRRTLFFCSRCARSFPPLRVEIGKQLRAFHKTQKTPSVPPPSKKHHDDHFRRASRHR